MPSVGLGGLLLLVTIARPATAQIDYRNLDDDRPTVTEDAYPVERYAFELLMPYRFERMVGGSRLHLTVPELAYGLIQNGQIGLKLPFATLTDGSSVAEPAAGSRSGLAGVSLFGFYNFNTERARVPALALRADVSFGVGPLGGHGTRVAVKAIATRSWGATRLHLNVARGLGSEASLRPVDPLSRWSYGAAIDRTFFRQSLMFIGEITARRTTEGVPTEVNAGFGLRYQWHATTVFDAGIARRLRSDLGPDVALTVGLSHAFAIPGLMPRGR
ncbi:MAG: hypothetical protein V4558_03950 [Gemmatimonadota bacterium]